MDGLILTSVQITAGATTLVDAKLKPSQIDDLVSIFRGYLGKSATDYTLVSTFESQTDTLTSNRCAKLAACLNLWQENQFDVSGFAATAASRQGYFDSTDEENFRIFVYAFGLFWDLPFEISSRFLKGGSSGSTSQGAFVRSIV